MKVLYIINGLGFSHNTGIGGSDKRAVEIIRNIKESDTEAVLDILTTDSGHDLFTNSENLETNYFVIKRPFWWPKYINKYLIGRVFSYFYTAIVSFTKTKTLKDYDIFFSTSDFFFDVLPAWFFKKIHHKKMIAMIHHHIASPKEREGSIFINSLMYLSQRFSLRCIKKFADVIFLYDTPEGRKIKKLLVKGRNKETQKIFFVKNGIDSNLIDKVNNQKKIYDACFLGGLRYSKGINEFVPIWKTVTRKIPYAKLLVIGGGSDEILKKLKTDIKNSNLEKNIILTGPLSGTNLFEKVKSSKMLLFPSHEEGWGIAVCEAMYCGLPVVCYNLPAFEIFGDAIDKYKVGDYENLSKRALEYLDNPQMITEKERQLRETASKFTWDKVAKEETSIYEQITTS